MIQVSLISKMVPSPDWFIGVDSFNLCVNGKWLDAITIEVNFSPLIPINNNHFDHSFLTVASS